MSWALQKAVADRDFDGAKALLSKGCNPFEKSPGSKWAKGTSAADLAAESGLHDYLSEFAAFRKAPLSKDDHEDLMLYAAKGGGKCLSEVMKMGESWMEAGGSILESAVNHKVPVAEIRALFEKRISCDMHAVARALRYVLSSCEDPSFMRNHITQEVLDCTLLFCAMNSDYDSAGKVICLGGNAFAQTEFGCVANDYPEAMHEMELAAFKNKGISLGRSNGRKSL